MVVSVFNKCFNFYKTRSDNLKHGTLSKFFFWSLITESHTRFSKFTMVDPIWPSLYYKNVSVFIQLSQVTEKTLLPGFLRC